MSLKRRIAIAAAAALFSTFGCAGAYAASPAAGLQAQDVSDYQAARPKLEAATDAYRAILKGVYQTAMDFVGNKATGKVTKARFDALTVKTTQAKDLALPAQFHDARAQALYDKAFADYTVTLDVQLQKLGNLKRLVSANNQEARVINQANEVLAEKASASWGDMLDNITQLDALFGVSPDDDPQN